MFHALELPTVAEKPLLPDQLAIFRLFSDYLDVTYWQYSYLLLEFLLYQTANL